MTTPHFDEPGGEATARVAQMAAMGVTVLEALARLNAQRGDEMIAADERAASVIRQQRLTDHAAARLTWTPALDDDWLRRATTQDLGRAWAAALPWASTDPDAAEAFGNAETRLSKLHPEAMAEYHLGIAGGATHGQAMKEAAVLFAKPPAIESRADERDPAKTASQREPRAISDDAYPYPTTQAVATAARTRDGAHVVTSAPSVQSHSRATAKH